MGSSSLCDFDHFSLCVSGIVLLMLSSSFSLILSKHIGACIDTKSSCAQLF